MEGEEDQPSGAVMVSVKRGSRARKARESATEKNLGDIFTKPMKNATQFRALRRLVMNERD